METVLNRETTANPLKNVLLIGLLAGTLDISAAFVYAYLASGTTPVRVLQYIAGGVLGKAAFDGGIFIAVLGIVLHYFIAFTWTVLLFLIYPKIKALSINPIFTGIVYGLIVWLVMNLIVLPLSNVPKPPFSITIHTFIGIGILMLCIGLPVSILSDRYYSGREFSGK